MLRQRSTAERLVTTLHPLARALAASQAVAERHVIARGCAAHMCFQPAASFVAALQFEELSLVGDLEILLGEVLPRGDVRHIDLRLDALRIRDAPA